MSGQDAVQRALGMHPECAYGDFYNGMSWNFEMTWVVKLWRTEECYLAGDPPRHVVESFPATWQTQGVSE